MVYFQLQKDSSTDEKMKEASKDVHDYLAQILEKVGMETGASSTTMVSYALSALLLLLLCYVVHWITRKVFLRFVTSFAQKTKNQWDDAVIKNLVFDRLAHITPALVLYLFSSVVFQWSENINHFVERMALAYMVLMVARAVDGFLSAIVDIYRNFDKAKNRPIRSYIQVTKIFLYIIAGILLISSLLDKDPTGILFSLGGMSAILLLVFKDSIMGLVASVQLVNNDMVRRDDWITLPQYGVDGDVMDITLNTVKIKNFDNTISTVPTYALISGAFQNWRGMQESGGRRIKRAINVDMNTIHFCDSDMIERFREFDLLQDYLEEKLSELKAQNITGAEQSRVTNGRRLSNVGTFRAYIVAYLKKHPQINKELTFLVRQLAPGELGLPIELYVFCSDKVWANYEAIQGDIFDHLLAIMPEFGLKPFQHASGNDFQKAFIH